MSVQARLVHITFALGTPPADQLAVHKVIDDNALDWMRYISNCYLIWTHIELASWTNLLKTVPNMENEFFLISSVDPNSPIDGWLPKWAWDWFKKYRGIHPPPPWSDLLLSSGTTPSSS